MPVVNTLYATPLTVRVSVGTETPLRVSDCSVPLLPWAGSMASSPFAPVPRVMLKVSLFPLMARLSNEDALRPSVQVSSCLAEITGTPRALAAAMICALIASLLPSLWMLATNVP